MELTEYRLKIDEIDREIVTLFAKRMAVSKAIGTYKKERNLPIYQEAREQEKLNTLAALSSEELTPYVAELYQTIFALSRAYQENTP